MTDFAALVDGWPDQNLLSALSEYADDYQVEQLVAVLAEARARGLQLPAGLLELDPGSETERQALANLQHTRDRETAEARHANSKLTLWLAVGLIATIALVAGATYVTGSLLDAAVFVVLLPVIVVVYFVKRFMGGVLVEGAVPIATGDMDTRRKRRKRRKKRRPA